MPELVAAFALATVVLTASALALGIVERAPLSFLIGDRDFRLFTLGLENSTPENMAVLFLDTMP